MYKFTDTHCHIEFDVDNIIYNAKKSNVTRIINNGVDITSNNQILKIAEEHKDVFAAIGIHPENIIFDLETYLEYLETNVPNAVAIGEIGLDYVNGNKNHELQKDIFKMQLELATKYSKPVIIHNRDAHADTVEILKKYPKVKGIIHCFTGTLKEANEYISLGFKLGINGIITFKNFSNEEMIKKIPLESIVLETDSPYLTPVPLRGTVNEPANIMYIAEKICTIKGITMDELSSITEKNVDELFDI